jgi:hypothetical protein
MKTTVLGLFCGLFLVAAVETTAATPASQGARVSVAFQHPESYTDVGPWGSEREKNGTLKNLGAAMQRSAATFLREELRLEVKVKDIDLAGDIEGWRGGAFDRLRVIRDVYPPRMNLSYRLLDARGRILAEGQEKLIDPNFLFGASPDLDPLTHDKALFRDWLRKEFSEYRR